MLPKPVRMLVLVGAALVAGASGPNAPAAEAEVEPQKPAAQEAKPDLKEALKGFKGFLVGELVRTTDEGIVLLVRAVTLVEGNQAANPGVLLGKETAVEFATEKDDQGRERPAPWLVAAAKRMKDLPAIALGGMGGNAVVIVDAGNPGQAAAVGRAMRLMTRRMTMRVNGMDVQLGGDEDDEPKREPKGPTLTARVRGDDEGKLIMDRVLPGSQPGQTWAAMPKLQFANGDEPARVEMVGVEAEAQAAEAMALKAQQKAMKAQIEAVTHHLAALKQQLAQAEALPEEHVAQLHDQQAELLDRLAALKKQAAMLKEATARRKAMAIQAKRRAAALKEQPPPKDPKDTDF